MKYAVHRNFRQTVLTLNGKPLYAFSNTQMCADYISNNLAGVPIEWNARPDPMTEYIKKLDDELCGGASPSASASGSQSGFTKD
jgi:hypothetical protein